MLETVMLASALLPAIVLVLCLSVQQDLWVEERAVACIAEVPENCDGLSMKGLRFYLDVRSQTSQQLRKAGAPRRRKATTMSPIGVTYAQAKAIIQEKLHETILQLAEATARKWLYSVSQPEFLDAFEREVELSTRRHSLENQLANLRDFGITKVLMTMWVPGENTVLMVEG
jgi:hypothetical protein